MQVLRWSKVHEVYVPEVDAEHRSLFRLTQELQDAMEGGAPPAQVRSRFRNLVSGVEDHLSHEERMMRAARYGSYTWHKQSHDGMRRKVKQCALRVERGDRSAIATMLAELAAWFKGHMALQDRLMATYLRNYRRCHKTAS